MRTLIDDVADLESGKDLENGSRYAKYSQAVEAELRESARLRAYREIDHAALRHRCPKCEAAPGQWCLTASHNETTHLHNARLNAIVGTK